MVLKVVTHEDYLAAITRAVCAAFPATADALKQVHLVFGAGPRRRGLSTLHRVWGGGEAVDPLPLVEIAAIRRSVASGDLACAAARTGARCWRRKPVTARRGDMPRGRSAWCARGRCLTPANWPTGEQSHRPCSPRCGRSLYPIEPAPAEFFEDRHRLPCGAGYGTRGGTSRGKGSGSRYLKVVCGHPGCGYQVKITRRWLAIGAPQCPVAGHGSMVLEATPASGQLRLVNGSARGATPAVLFAGGVGEAEG